MSGLIEEMCNIVSDVIGDDGMARDVVMSLVQRLGGERIYIPHNDYEKRNREILELYENGASVVMIARRARISERSVYRILKTEGEKHD